MSAKFFLILLAFIGLPALISRALRIERVLPLVFLQLLLGVGIQLTGLNGWLRNHGLDLVDGQLAASVQGIGWLGVVLLVALSGAHAQPKGSDDKPLRFIVISVAGFVVTLVAGTVLGLALLDMDSTLAGQRGTPALFGASIGICLAVTALPVLVAILREIGLATSSIGKLATQTALLDDLWLWLGLTAVLSLAGLDGNHPLQMMVSLAAYMVVMVALVRPILQRLYCRLGDGPHEGALLGVSVILLSAAVTDALGVHAMLGAFIGGAVLPPDSVRSWGANVANVVKFLLIPVFFVSTGLRLHIQWQDPNFWGLVAAFAVTATVVKGSTAAVAARATGLPWSKGLLLGSLMQCKGLMELIAINVLYEAGIIGVEVYSALAVMALVSTFITAPLLRFWTADKHRTEGADVATAGSY